ncbi:hypothetical protein A2U01_0065753, partial [Trifolium medium]|nr:hypothetical protein [Trifolium medium]
MKKKHMKSLYRARGRELILIKLSQMQRKCILKLKQPSSEPIDDIDPSLFEPLNIVPPPQTSDLPPITS